MAYGKGEHPRLLCSAAEVAEIREKSQHGMRAKARAFILGWAERLLDPASPHYFDIKERRREIWEERGCFWIWRAAMMLLTYAYLVSGNRRYGEAARDALMITIEQGLADRGFRDQSPQYDGWRRNKIHQHDKGCYAITICTVFDCCHDLFDEAQRQKFRAHAVESLDIFLDPVVMTNDRVFITNNRGVRSFVGCAGYYPLTLEGESERGGGSLSAAINSAAEAFVLAAFDQDGYPLEGWSYAGALTEIFLFFHAVARSGRCDLRRLPVFQRCLEAMIYEVLPGGYTCHFLNDCEYICGGAQPFIGLMGRAEGALVPWLMQQIDLNPQRLARCENHLIDAYFESAWLQVALFWDERVPVKTPAELGYPLSRCFMQAGVAAMRTGWGAEDYLVVQRCGRAVPLMHRQSDQNHLSLFALGERFLIDEGYGQANGMQPEDVPEEVRRQPERYFGQTHVHNTVMIDGRSQNGTNVDVGAAEGRIRDWEHTEAYDTTLGDAFAAYGENRVIAEAMRRVVLVRKAAQPFLIVIDTAAVDEGPGLHEFEVLWRTDKKNRIRVDGQTFVIHGTKHDCWCQVVYGNVPFGVTVREHVLCPQARVTARARRLEMVTVLCPVRRGEAPPAFNCGREAGGDFVVRARCGPVEHVVTAGTRTVGPLKQAVAVRYERQDGALNVGTGASAGPR